MVEVESGRGESDYDRKTILPERKPLDKLQFFEKGNAETHQQSTKRHRFALSTFLLDDKLSLNGQG